MTVTSNYLEINGVRQHYIAAGHGPLPVVLTHGNSLCGGVWRPLVEALAGDEFTAIAVDLRGHGWAGKPDGGYGWASLRDDLVGLVTALDLRDVLFVGHSRGGGVALLAAAALRERTRGALLYEPTVSVRLDEQGRPAPIPNDGRTATMAERAERRREVFPDRAALAAHYRPRDAFRGWRQDYFDAFIEYGTQINPDGTASPCMPGRVAARLFEVLYEFDAWRDVSAPDLPVHVVYGEHGGRLGPGRDPLAPIRALFPAATSSVMAGATHTGPMEHPDEFEALVRDFSRRHPTSGLFAESDDGRAPGVVG